MRLATAGPVQFGKLLHRFRIAFAGCGREQNARLIAIFGHAIAAQI